MKGPKKGWKTLSGPLLTLALLAGIFGFMGCSSDGDDSSDVITKYYNLFVASQGTSLVLYNLDDNGALNKLSSAALPEIPTFPMMTSYHAIFGITRHPTKPWLYTGSLNECSDNNFACWGNARIDRFSYSASGGISHDGVAFAYYSSSGPACAASDSGYVEQSGLCAPTTLAFSPDGLRLYVDCDELDGVQIFSVDPATGDLQFIWEGSSTSYNGLTASPDSAYLYNGSSVITLTGDTAAVTVNNAEGNATEVFTNATGGLYLITTEGNTDLSVYDLSDQAAPALIDSLLLNDAPTINFMNSTSPAHFQAASDDLSLFTVVGAESVATVSFDGYTSLNLRHQLFDADNAIDVMNRSVAMTGSGSHAVVTWFKPYDAAGDRLLTGGITVYGIAQDGTLTALGTENLPVPSRFVLALP